jgi:3-hydroxyacyl-CoA dehydrogenase
MAVIRKVAVIGSGVMGGGIAAQVANAGVPVILLDVTRDVATEAVERLRAQRPPPFMDEHATRLIATGSIAEDMALVADCDWIIEAIVEKPDAKRDLYRRIENHRHAEAAVSSNTSTIPLAELMREAPKALKRRFLITHFFNPPRHMRLLEIVTSPETAAETAQLVSSFADMRLGKTVVTCKDRPGFIANRLGCFWMQCAISEAIARDVTVEEADAVMGKPFGIPRTGVFGLADLVGIDLLPKVNASLAATLGNDDLFHSVNAPLPVIDWMIGEGLIGRKGKGGFYRVNRESGKRKEALDLRSRTYRPATVFNASDADTLLADPGKLGSYARAVMFKTLAYAALLVGDAANDVQSIDAAMRLGYNWAHGPFQLMDSIGTGRLRKLISEAGLPVASILDAPAFYRDGQVFSADGTYRPLVRPPGVLALEDVKRRSRPLLRSNAANLWDLGDGVACFELTTKMNTLDSAVFAALDEAIDIVADKARALVFYSDAANFSAGINLNWVMEHHDDFERIVRMGQKSFKRLKYAGFPSVAAVAGLALGGGCELMLHASAVQAHAECYAGLVEASVGILPAWDGCGQLLERLLGDPRLPRGPMPAVSRAFEIIAAAQVSTSAIHARELGFLRPGDGITMNRDRLLADARERALSLVANYRPPDPPSFGLPGPSGRVALMMAAESQLRLGRASAHDMRVAAAIAEVLTGGDADPLHPCSEADLMTLERKEVLKLAALPETQARIRHTLDTGKPLRN